MSFLTYLFKPLAYISLPVLLLHTAANNSPLARYYIRLGIYLSSLGLCSAWGALVSIGMSLIGRRLDINWVVARSFLALAGWPLGINFEVEGEEHLLVRPTVLIGNHQSMLDVLVIGRMMPKHTSILAKKELQWIPLLGQFMTLSGAVFVDRGNNAKAVKSLAAAGNMLKKQSTSIFVFPEGTRTNKPVPNMLPFKKGAFHLAVQAGIPLTPVVVEHYYRLYHHGILGSGTLKIRVLPPVPTTGLSADDVPELAKKVREQMLATLHEISGTSPAVDPKGHDVPEEQHALLATPMPAEPIVDAREVEKDERASLPLSSPEDQEATPQSVRRDESDKGAETEEDEGMVLVDRPTT